MVDLDHMWKEPTRCTPFLINLFQLYPPVQVYNKQFHHQEVNSLYKQHIVLSF